ncbi:rCG64389 [Rattus norvegicus]|uniref:RCG64389 n=1 Tax=Rattus norvegicus TaxID=10116 RepID=A6I5C8_RAT|nr:rCG64389 [Rattus norvegicus]
MAFAGRLLWNLAGTMPLFPWAPVTFPQITLVLFGLPPEVTVLFFA